MPENFDDAPESQGTDNEFDLDPSTASGGEADDLLGEDAAQSDDHGGTPSGDEEDSNVSGDFLDQSTEALLLHDPQAGLEHVREKLNRFVKNQNKSYTKRMTKMAKEAKERDAVVTQWNQLNTRMQQLYQEDPDFVNLWMKKVRGENAGGGEDPKPKREIRTTTDLLKEVRSMIREEVGGLRGAYQEDQAKNQIDAFISRTKDDRLKSKRDQLIRVKSQNPEYSMKQVLAVVDPDLLGDMLYEQKRRKSQSPGGIKELSSFTVPKNKAFRTLDDAFDAAVAEIGDPEMQRPA